MGYRTNNSIQLSTKPDFNECMERVYAWYNNDIIDRVPVRFSAHNAEYNHIDKENRWKSLRDRWFDVEYQISKFEKEIENKEFLAETFPVYWPNLGPNVYACMLGLDVEFGEVTTWANRIMDSCDELDKLAFSKDSIYFKKLEELTYAALERCGDRYLVGYTDIHHGADCAAAFRGTQELCIDMYDNPEGVKKLISRCSADFKLVFNHFNQILKKHGQPSVTWINIPSFESFHIPGADFSAMVSNDAFREFILPTIKDEVKVAKHNVFHVDGKGVARHLDDILAIPEVNAIQWVQGLGKDEPIMQWVPLIKKIQSAGKGVVVDLKAKELESFINNVDPRGIYLCISSDDVQEQKDILHRLLKWK